MNFKTYKAVIILFLF